MCLALFCTEHSTRNRLSRNNCRNIAKSSDIDIFLYDLDETTALERIVYIEGIVRRAQRIMPGQGLTLRSENAITLISPKFPFRHVQVKIQDECSFFAY